METIKLEFPDGVVECNVLGSFQAEGTDFIALAPVNGEGDVFLYRYTEIEDKIELQNLSQEEFNVAAQEFQRILGESEK